MLFEFFNDSNVFISSLEKFNHHLMSIGIVNFTLDQPILGMVVEEISEYRSVVSMLN